MESGGYYNSYAGEVFIMHSICSEGTVIFEFSFFFRSVHSQLEHYVTRGRFASFSLLPPWYIP